MNPEAWRRIKVIAAERGIAVGALLEEWLLDYEATQKSNM
jgi:hypothetical protein